MKKTLRTILAGAVALLAVSCYDDSDLRGQIGKLDERLTALENTLNAEVGGINDLANRLENLTTILAGSSEDAPNLTELIASLDAADGEADGVIEGLADAIASLKEADETLNEDLLEAVAKIAVVAVGEENGNVVLTLADGSKVSLSKPVSNADNTNLVTIVEDESGVKYWAVVLADGTTQNLGVKVGVDVQFKVSADNSLMYSVNGGDWESTGAYVANNSGSLLTDFYQGEEFDYSLWEYVVDDFYTLVFGGVEYQLPLYKVDNSVVTIRAGKTYFEYGETFTVDVSLKDISTMYLMTKPDGWKAKLVGNVLTVTAPAETSVQSGDAEAAGEVLLHCTTTEGKCKIARLAVATTDGFSLTVTEDGQVTIINPEVATITQMETTKTDFNDAYVGLAPVSAFEADPAAYVAGIMDNYDDISFMIGNWKNNTSDDEGNYTVGGMYDPETYTVDVINTTVNDMYKFMKYSDLPFGCNFVVWACPVDKIGNPRVEDVVYGYFSKPIVATITAVENGTTTSDIALNVNVQGADTYYVGLVTEAMTYGLPIDQYMQMSEGPFGYLQMAIQYGMPEMGLQLMGTQFGGEIGDQMPETLMASYINYGEPLMPSSKVYIWVFPIVDGLALSEYTYEKHMKPYIYEFTTTDLVAGGTESVEMEMVSNDFSDVTVEISGTEGTEMIYYQFYTAEQFNAFANADAIAEDLLGSLVVAGSSAQVIASNSFRSQQQDVELSAGTTVFLAALAVDADGKYGAPVSKGFKTKELVYSSTFTASFGEEVYSPYSSGYKYDFPITVNGGEAAKYYYVFSSREFSDEDLKNLPLGWKANYDFTYTTSSVAENMLKGKYVEAGQTYYLAVVVESANGEYAPVIKKTVTAPAAE